MIIYVIDNRVDLRRTAELADWNRAALIERLMVADITRPDAEAFADFIFTDLAVTRDEPAEPLLTREQWARLEAF